MRGPPQTLHPRVLAAASQLLGCGADELRLAQSEIWEKSSINPVANNDQRMHADFPNHTLVVPPRGPEAVAMLVFWDDCDECGGPTHYVPRWAHPRGLCAMDRVLTIAAMFAVSRAPRKSLTDPVNDPRCRGRGRTTRPTPGR